MLSRAQFVSPDAMGAAAAHVAREYGPTGYVLACVVSDGNYGGLFLVRHSDGSLFMLKADYYGSVRRLPRDEVVELFGAPNVDSALS